MFQLQHHYFPHSPESSQLPSYPEHQFFILARYEMHIAHYIHAPTLSTGASGARHTRDARTNRSQPRAERKEFPSTPSPNIINRIVEAPGKFIFSQIEHRARFCRLSFLHISPRSRWEPSYIYTCARGNKNPKWRRELDSPDIDVSRYEIRHRSVANNASLSSDQRRA